VTHQRVTQIVAERDDFPKPARVIGRHRLWRRKDVERWRDAKPRVWAPAE
jgi:predicted DNA-binding transcriptional regulator AlpA